ncbi:MAG: hypothetical protein ACD_78C00091G0005 [uncultured bacterium (gcode 4)]|uniref:Uncharacterized protein n=1 Tax=uncultured bacterium (gcode 4) TaxID=1234023 RepID=K1YDJ3_9BACT|nr:MAG: hypothetical protein ACD_78C00091G0005 [uncultured bacterium (gcode 4)]
MSTQYKKHSIHHPSRTSSIQPSIFSPFTAIMRISDDFTIHFLRYFSYFSFFESKDSFILNNRSSVIFHEILKVPLSGIVDIVLSSTHIPEATASIWTLFPYQSSKEKSGHHSFLLWDKSWTHFWIRISQSISSHIREEKFSGFKNCPINSLSRCFLCSKYFESTQDRNFIFAPGYEFFNSSR